MHVVACMEGSEKNIASTQIDDDSETEEVGICGADVVPLSKPISVEALRRLGTFIDVGCSDESEADEGEPDRTGQPDMDVDNDIEEWAANTQLLHGGLTQALEAVMDDDEQEGGKSADANDHDAWGALVICEDIFPAERRVQHNEHIQHVAPSEVPRSLPKSSQGWEDIWSMLVSLGWTMESGPRGSQSQSYYLPPGVKRGPGAKVRKDYFDSREQVLRFLREECQRLSGVPAPAPVGKAKTMPCAEVARPPPQHANTTDRQPAGRATGAKMSSWHMLWAQLHVKGWRLETGPRGNQTQTYYMPPGVKRGPGAKNRIDYFDSKAMVLRHLHSTGAATLRTPTRSGRKRRADCISGQSVIATQESPPHRRFSHESARDMDAIVLPEDAPVGHVAHVMVKMNMHHTHPLVSFRYQDVPFQTTFAAAGSRHAAEVIARACWLKFEAGWDKKDVKQFRDMCYRRSVPASAPVIQRVLPLAKRSSRPQDELQFLGAAGG